MGPLLDVVTDAKNSLFIIDNYLDVQLFDLYMERAAPAIDIRILILTDQLRGAVQTVAGKFSKRGHFELRRSGVQAQEANSGRDDTCHDNHRCLSKLYAWQEKKPHGAERP